jgi:REP element-mobilizing transposase RayT
MPAWNGWYHVTGNTYGTWLPGDPRGWRERGHRKHVGGDYHDPPHGVSTSLHQYSRDLLQQQPVHLDRVQREVAGKALVEMLVRRQIEVLAMAVDQSHFHTLGRFTDTNVRPIVGRAKKHAFFKLRDQGYSGKLWGHGADVVPITGRRHQVSVFNYIVRHATHGAWVWTFREGIYWETDFSEEADDA